MSVHVLSWVLRNSTAAQGDRLVLISLADHANEDGSSSWPSIETISRHANMDRRTVQRCIRRLEQSGHVTRAGISAFGTTIWEIPMGGGEMPGGGVSSRNRDQTPPNPSLNPSVDVVEPTTALSSLDAAVVEPQASVVARDPEAIRLAAMLSDAIRTWTTTPEASGKHRPTAQWEIALERLHRIDHRGWQDIEDAITWLAGGSAQAKFWQGNVMSGGKLREQFDKLVMASQRGQPSQRTDLWRTMGDDEEAA